MENWKDIRSMNMEELTETLLALGEKNSGQNRFLDGYTRNWCEPWKK